MEVTAFKLPFFKKWLKALFSGLITTLMRREIMRSRAELKKHISRVLLSGLLLSIAGTVSARLSLSDLNKQVQIIAQQDRAVGTQLLIDSVVVSESLATTMYDIQGINFTCGADPTVELGGMELTVISCSPTGFIAEDVGITTPGSYLLSVELAGSTTKEGFDSFEVAVGAVGPAGLPGEDGEDGLQGASGVAGTRGPAGPPGAPGGNGIDGAQGISGAEGIQGPIGPQGPAGEAAEKVLKAFGDDALEHCNGGFEKGGWPRLTLPFFLSPATAGIMVDTDSNSRWSYGYIATELYMEPADPNPESSEAALPTSSKGRLKCGVTVDVRAIVEDAMDLGMGALCTTFAALSLSDPKFERADTFFCGLVDSVIRAVNAGAWLGISTGERLRQEVINGGDIGAVKTANMPSGIRSVPNGNLLGDELNLLTIDIPRGPAEVIVRMKSEIEAPINALTEGKIKIGPVEWALEEFTPPHEIVIDLLDADGMKLLRDNPPKFVSKAAQEIVTTYFDQIVSEELILAIINEASQIEFIDTDGNEAFKIALTDVTNTGIDLKNGTGIGFKFNGSELMSLDPTAATINLEDTAFRVTPNKISFQIEGTEVITASKGDVCLLGLCKSEIASIFVGIGVKAAIPGVVAPTLQALVNEFQIGLNSQAILLGKVNTLAQQALDLASPAHTFALPAYNKVIAVEGQLETLSTFAGDTFSEVRKVKDVLSVDGIPFKRIDDLNKLAQQALDLASPAHTFALPAYNTVNDVVAIITEPGSTVVGDRFNNLFNLVHSMNSILASVVNVDLPKIKGHLSNLVGDVSGWFSDARLKKDVTPLSASLNRVLKLRGVTHGWNEDAQALGISGTDRVSIGFIAQEVEQIVPELVSENEQGYLTVNYAKMAPLLVEGIKEQQSQIEGLQRENDQLKSYICDKDPAAAFCAD